MTRVLVADAEPLIRQLFSGFLQEELGTGVDVASTGGIAASLIVATHFRFALIDAVLADVSGLVVGERAANANIPVLLTSGHPESLCTLKQFDFPHLQKPFSLESLAAEAASIMRDVSDNVRRVRTAAAKMRASAEAADRRARGIANRCYCLAADNRIIRGLHVDAADVEAAIKSATTACEGMPDFRSVEIWLGSTRVFPPPPLSDLPF